MSNFPEKKRKKSKIISASNQKIFFIKKLAKKIELLVQIAKDGGQKVETTDQKKHNFQLRRLGKKESERTKKL